MADKKDRKEKRKMKKREKYLDDYKRSIGRYNPVVKIYALGKTEAGLKIGDYLVGLGKGRQYVDKTDKKTKFIFKQEKISKLEKKGYELVNYW